MTHTEVQYRETRVFFLVLRIKTVYITVECVNVGSLLK